MAKDLLAAALSAVKWDVNVSFFVNQQLHLEKIDSANLRLAIWARQLEAADRDNPALSFVREMQTSGQQVAVLVSLGLYKPAAASMRTVIETALYFTYFRTHPSELATLHKNKDYYISKDDILDYHKVHSYRFNELQAKLGLLQRLKDKYKYLSAIVHGQVPGVWTQQLAIKDISHVPQTMDSAVMNFDSACDIVHRLFLCTIAQTLWDDFDSQSKKPLLSGLTGEEKAILKLDIK